MDKKALLKTILCIVGFFDYLTLVILACLSESPVFLGAVLGPLVILAIVSVGRSLYDYFKD